MSSINGLTIAVPRGALFDDTVALLTGMGMDTAELRSNDRKLLFEDIGVITMRPSDVPTYVEAGAADLGVTGKDVLLEQAAQRARATAGARCTSCSTSATAAARWCSRARPARTPRSRRCGAWA